MLFTRLVVCFIKQGSVTWGSVPEAHGNGFLKKGTKRQDHREGNEHGIVVGTIFSESNDGGIKGEWCPPNLYIRPPLS